MASSSYTYSRPNVEKQIFPNVAPRTVESVDYSQSGFPYAGLKLTDKFKTTMFPHQAETVEWMLYREEVPFDNVRGGLVLSLMGLGKTLSSLATVVLNGGLTLVVVPAQLVYVWESEITRHFQNVTYFAYHGPNRKKRFEKYHLKNGNPQIMLMSYQSIPTDVEDAGGPLMNIPFHRIIYDECHYIKNQHTEVFKAICRVKSPVKWFLSGTPIMNRIQEMYPYLKLLNYKHISRVPQFARRGRNGYIAGANGQKPEEVKKDGYLDMQNLLRVIAIRRTKEVLDLPSKTYQEILVTLGDSEREFYTILQAYSRERVKKLMRNIRKVSNSGLTPGEQNRLRVIILQCMLSLIFHLRVACCDPLLVIDKISRTRDLDMRGALIELKKDSTESDCQVCFNDDATVVNNICGHAACGDCWKKLSKMDVMRCFTCMQPTTLLNLHEKSAEKKKDLKKAHDERIFHRSSKSRVVLQKIKEELAKGNKVVVVSQWTTYLDHLMKQFSCENAGVRSVLLNGKTLPIKRQKIVDQFQAEEDIKVCFASLGSSAEGITLHSACSMILCDVYWNAAKISQISDRIHRIGQKRDVNVFLVYVEDTIEMKLKELVEKKDIICKVVVDCAPVTNNVDSWLSRMIKLMD